MRRLSCGVLIAVALAHHVWGSQPQPTNGSGQLEEVEPLDEDLGTGKVVQGYESQHHPPAGNKDLGEEAGAGNNFSTNSFNGAAYAITVGRPLTKPICKATFTFSV